MNKKLDDLFDLEDINPQEVDSLEEFAEEKAKIKECVEKIVRENFKPRTKLKHLTDSKLID